jgi:hypothetical protein
MAVHPLSERTAKGLPPYPTRQELEQGELEVGLVTGTADISESLIAWLKTSFDFLSLSQGAAGREREHDLLTRLIHTMVLEQVRSQGKS